MCDELMDSESAFRFAKLLRSEGSIGLAGKRIRTFSAGKETSALKPRQKTPANSQDGPSTLFRSPNLLLCSDFVKQCNLMGLAKNISG